MKKAAIRDFFPPAGILIIISSLLCIPFLMGWEVTGVQDSSAYSNNPRLREALIFSLTLSVPELLNYAADVRTYQMESFWKIILLLAGSTANILVVAFDCRMEVIMLAVGLKPIFCILLCCLNIILCGHLRISFWIFNIMILSLTTAIATSTWLIYSKLNSNSIFIFCMISFGIGISLLLYFFSNWKAKMSKNSFHTLIFLITIFIICIGQMALISIYFSNSEVNDFFEYSVTSILIVSISMHAAWFIHGQINRMEIARASVSTI